MLTWVDHPRKYWEDRDIPWFLMVVKEAPMCHAVAGDAAVVPTAAVAGTLTSGIISELVGVDF